MDVPKIYQQTNTSCKTTSEEMVNAFFKNKGISGYEVAPFSGEGYVSIVKEDKSKKNEIIGTDGKAYDSLENNALDLQDTKDEAMDYVNEHLDSGIPVVVGVDHTYNAVLPSQKTAVGNGGSDKDVTGYNSDKTTDHFIVITGKGFDAEKNLPYYTYNDPGYRDKSGNLNRLYPKTIDGNTFWVDEDDSSSATAADGSARRYVLSAVCAIAFAFASPAGHDRQIHWHAQRHRGRSGLGMRATRTAVGLPARQDGLAVFGGHHCRCAGRRR